MLYSNENKCTTATFSNMHGFCRQVEQKKPNPKGTYSVILFI